MQNYYLYRNKEWQGPYSMGQLRSMWHSGALTTDTYYRQDDPGEWFQLSALAEQLEPPTSPTIPPPVPAPTPPPLASQRSITAQHSGEPASFGARFGAYIIDAIVGNIAAFICAFIILVIIASAGGTSKDGLQGIGSLVGLVTVWLYYALMESSSKQATVGKLACGLVVTDMQGQRIGFGQASGRYVSMIVSFLTLGIGFLMCAWTERKQCLHDMMASCLVLKK